MALERHKIKTINHLVCIYLFKDIHNPPHEFCKNSFVVLFMSRALRPRHPSAPIRGRPAGQKIGPHFSKALPVSFSRHRPIQ
jgi:hypothetical protein